MITNSKRFQILKNIINKPIYSFDEGISLLKNLNTTKFIESTEAHITLDLKNTKQQIKGILTLPNSTIKLKKIAIYTDENINDELIKLGAYKVGFDTLLDEIKSGNIDFDILLTSSNLISKLSIVGKKLGLKGLMPSLKNGTITDNFILSLNEFNKGKFEYKSDKNNVIHVTFGKTNLTDAKLKENLLYIYNEIKKSKPLNIKGRYIKTLYICNSMSPSIKLFI